MVKGGSHYGAALSPNYRPIFMKIGKQVGFYVYYLHNWGPRNFDKN